MILRDTCASSILKEKEASGGRESQHGPAIITEYTVHPNPFRDKFEIKALLDKSAALKVQLVNMVTNKTVFEDKLKENEHHQKKYTLNNLVSGVKYS